MEETDIEEEKPEEETEEVIETPVIKETNAVNKDRIKDIHFSVNTMTSGRASYVTPHINGVFEGVLISTNNSVEIHISLDDNALKVFDIQNFQGQQFIPVRIGTVDRIGEAFRDSASKWPLNNKLRFDVKGGYNAEINFMVRYT